MNTPLRLPLICAATLAAATTGSAQVPRMISYQGHVRTASGTPFTGVGSFRFALVDHTGTNTYWSNDGTTGAGAMPAGTVQVPVNNGVYSLHLGNTALEGMTAGVPPEVFANPSVHLRVWFSDGSGPPVLMTPDTRVGSAPSAMIAATVADGAITTAKLAGGAVTGSALSREISLGSAASGPGVFRLSSGSPTSPASSITFDGGTGEVSAAGGFFLADPGAVLPPGAESTSLATLTAAYYGGLLQLYDENYARVALLGAHHSNGAGLTLFQEGGKYGAYLNSGANNAGGEMALYDGDGQVRLGLSVSSGAGDIKVRNSSGDAGVIIDGHSNGAGSIELYEANGTTVGIDLKGDVDGDNSGGRIKVNQGDGDVGIYLDGDHDGSGHLSVRDKAGIGTIEIDGAESTGRGGHIHLFKGGGEKTIEIDGSEGDGKGGHIHLFNGSGEKTIEIDGDDLGSGGRILLYDQTGENKIELDANASGGARVTTNVLEITGGSDLSENFDVSPAGGNATPEPGMIVSIDPARPGKLTVSSRAYDRTVAGVMSGAGGVKPGMLMGQRGTAASGKHPVALTGRVYCHADASNGSIEPGDLLTTSDVSGHAMKVTDHSRAQGAIIGKAMTPLTGGRGLVLVLVSLQ